MGSGKRLWGSFRLGKALSKISYYSVIPSHWDPWSYHKEGWIGSKNIIDTNFCFCSRSSTKFQIRLTDTGENVQKWTRVFSTRRWVILVARTRRKKERKIACPLLDAFACAQVSRPRLYRLKLEKLIFFFIRKHSHPMAIRSFHRSFVYFGTLNIFKLIYNRKLYFNLIWDNRKLIWENYLHLLYLLDSSSAVKAGSFTGSNI